MKKLLLVLVTLFSTSVFAESAITSVGHFKGEIFSLNVKITNIKIVLVNRFCPTWSSSCYDGYSNSVELPIKIKPTHESIVTFTHERESQLESSKFGQAFSECHVKLVIHGTNEYDEYMSGDLYMITQADKNVCASREKMTQLLNKRLTQTISVSYLSGDFLEVHFN